MHPVDVHADGRGKYVDHVDKYDFSPLSFPIPLQAVGSFALRKNMSINICGVDDDNEVIYPLRVSSTLVPDRHVDLLLFERDGVQHYATIIHFSRLVGRQLSNHGHTELITDAGILRKQGLPNLVTDCLTAMQYTVATLIYLDANNLTLNQPIYVGFSVLHLSKLNM